MPKSRTFDRQELIDAIQNPADRALPAVNVGEDEISYDYFGTSIFLRQADRTLESATTDGDYVLIEKGAPIAEGDFLPNDRVDFSAADNTETILAGILALGDFIFRMQSVDAELHDELSQRDYDLFTGFTSLRFALFLHDHFHFDILVKMSLDDVTGEPLSKDELLERIQEKTDLDTTLVKIHQKKEDLLNSYDFERFGNLAQNLAKRLSR